MAEGNGVALVTGASSGIGAVYADRLAGRGKDLVLVARRRARLEELAASLEARHGRRIEIVAADLGDPAGLATVQAILRDREDIYILVNNAGLGALGASVSVAPEAVEQLVQVNVLALTMLSIAVAPRFMKAGCGTIVNLASLIAFKASAFAAAYCASKAYVVNFSRSMQAEFAGTGVRIQLVIPGPVHTEFFGDREPSLPGHLFFTAETLVDCAMQALDRGELICIPALHDPDAWTGYEEALRRITDATQNPDPAPRYRAAAD